MFFDISVGACKALNPGSNPGAASRSVLVRALAQGRLQAVCYPPRMRAATRSAVACRA